MAEPKSDAAPPIVVEDLRSLITSASRLLFVLSTLEPFKNAGIGLAEWLTLSALANKDGISNKQLARFLGVTGQRVNQLCSALVKAKLIAIQSSAEDNRRNVIKITDAGKKQNDALNTALQAFLTMALKEKSRALPNASRNVRMLTRLVMLAVPDKKQKIESDGGAPSE